ncbi:MAG: ABC transporter substrate-binding protein [Alphaproteobacteria bacterium]|nr:ABC transporter substrate-binding protein [Alphaproteobacteria bacterium]
MTVAMLAVTTIIVSGTQMAAAADKVKLGALRFTSHSGAFVAHEKGYFTAEGLEVELVFFQAAAPMAVAIASGDIDYGVTAISGGLINLANKGAIKIIGGALVEEKGVDGQKILVSNAAFDAGVTTPAKLAGRSFGITQTGSSFHYMISQIAAKEGIAADDVSLKALQKVGAIIGALKSGQIDSWTIVPHIAKGLAGSGGAKIIGNVADYIDDYQVTTIFTSTKNATEKRDLTKRFLRAYSKGIADFNANMIDKTEGEGGVDATTKLIHKYVYVERPLEKAAPPIKAGSMRLQPNAKLNLSSVRHQLEWFQGEGLVSKDITIDQLVDSSYVETY